MVGQILENKKYFYIDNWSRNIEIVMLERIENGEHLFKIQDDFGGRYLTKDVLYATKKEAEQKIRELNGYETLKMYEDTNTLENLMVKIYSCLHDENTSRIERDVIRKRVLEYLDIIL